MFPNHVIIIHHNQNNNLWFWIIMMQNHHDFKSSWFKIIVFPRVAARSWSLLVTLSTLDLHSSSQEISFPICLLVMMIIMMMISCINQTDDDQFCQTYHPDIFRSHWKPHRWADPGFCWGLDHDDDDDWLMIDLSFGPN